MIYPSLNGGSDEADCQNPSLEGHFILLPLRPWNSFPSSSLILVNKPTGLNRKKKHPQGHNDFSTWLYTLFQLGKEFLHINNLIPCLKSTEPWCTNITRMWDTSMWSVNTGVQLHRKSVNFIIKVGKMRMDIFSIWSIFCESW